jgi:catechol 2,3-dioxygenase-like lactoylglutathione lyase family enzyme
MTHAAVIAGLALLLAAPAWAQPAAGSATPGQEPAQEIVSVMSRMTLVVRDLEASKRFYTYALGYQLAGERLIDNPIVKVQMGIAQDRAMRFAILRSSHVINGEKRDGAGIGLIEIGNPSLPMMARPDGAVLAAGEAMMAVRTTDIALVHARLKELGARILLEPMKSPDGRETELVVHDPDGVRIHVVERADRPAPTPMQSK